MNKKKIPIIIATLFCVIIIATIILLLILKQNENKPDNTKKTQPEEEPYVYYMYDGDYVTYNTSDAFTKEKKYNGVILKEAVLIQDNKAKVAEFTVDIINTTNKKTDVQKIYIVTLDKNGKELQRFLAHIPDLEPSGSGKFMAQTTKNVVGAYDYKVIKY